MSVKKNMDLRCSPPLMIRILLFRSYRDKVTVKLYAIYGNYPSRCMSLLCGVKKSVIRVEPRIADGNDVSTWEKRDG